MINGTIAIAYSCAKARRKMILVRPAKVRPATPTYLAYLLHKYISLQPSGGRGAGNVIVSGSISFCAVIFK